MSSSPPVTVIIPTRRGFAHCRDAVSSVLPQVEAVGGELLLASTAPVPDAPPGVRVVVSEGDDVFLARAAGVAAARGEVVVILEDHSLLRDDGFLTGLLAAWARHPEAGGLVHAVDNGAHGVLDEASFLVTLSPFVAPMPEVPTDRIPVPGIVSYRRSELPTEPPPPGWLEYELPVELLGQGRLASTDDVAVTHVQRAGLGYVGLHFHSGRAFGASTGAGGRRRVVGALRVAGRNGLAMWRQTRRNATKPARPQVGARIWAGVAALCAANAAGQVVGAVAGEGRSRAALE